MDWCAVSRRMLDASHSHGHPPLQHCARLAVELAKITTGGTTFTKLVRAVASACGLIARAFLRHIATGPSLRMCCSSLWCYSPRMCAAESSCVQSLILGYISWAASM